MVGHTAMMSLKWSIVNGCCVKRSIPSWILQAPTRNRELLSKTRTNTQPPLQQHITPSIPRKGRKLLAAAQRGEHELQHLERLEHLALLVAQLNDRRLRRRLVLPLPMHSRGSRRGRLLCALALRLQRREQRVQPLQLLLARFCFDARLQSDGFASVLRCIDVHS
jgi:hypothetical protein